MIRKSKITTINVWFFVGYIEQKKITKHFVVNFIICIFVVSMVGHQKIFSNTHCFEVLVVLPERNNGCFFYVIKIDTNKKHP